MAGKPGVRIDSVSFGEVSINGKVFYSDMVVWWDGRRDFRENSHVLGMDEFVGMLEKKPDSLVVGTGMSGMLGVEQGVLDLAEEQGMKVFVDKSPNAAEIFNGLVGNGRKAVAVIHATC
jgi:hypothetical protein